MNWRITFSRPNPKETFVLQFYCFLIVIQVMRNLDKFGSLVDLKAVLVVQVHLSLAQTTTISLKSLKGMSLT